MMVFSRGGGSGGSKCPRFTVRVGGNADSDSSDGGNGKSHGDDNIVMDLVSLSKEFILYAREISNLLLLLSRWFY